MKNTSFSNLVSGSEPVINAFETCPAARAWWRIIMWLHGKPTAPDISFEERGRIVADGFKFYAQIYRFLGVLFWLVGAATWLAGLFEDMRDASYWAGAATLAGVFLWIASGVGFSGARALRQNKPSAHLMLGSFMVAIVAFLSGLTALLSLAIQQQTTYNSGLNLFMVAIVWAFGIGSYLIEILYLVADRPLEVNRIRSNTSE